jgi:hypothetical protein
VANFLVLRGADQMSANVDALQSRDLYTRWSVDGLLVGTHSQALGGFSKTASLLR